MKNLPPFDAACSSQIKLSLGNIPNIHITNFSRPDSDQSHIFQALPRESLCAPAYFPAM